MPARVGELLSLAYRDLVGAEARLAEALAPRGVHVGATLADQWPVLHEYLSLYARGLSAAGLVVLGGAPDAGSRATGIPFTGAPEARARMGLSVAGASESPSGAAFWRAVERARATAGDAPLESLFGTMHLTHAHPFDFGAHPEAADAAARHTLRVLEAARPQVVVAVGAEALATLGRALRNRDLVDLARGDESTWIERWPPGSRMVDHPYAEVPVPRPFRARVVPVPSLAGPCADAGERALAAAFSYVLA